MQRRTFLARVLGIVGWTSLASWFVGVAGVLGSFFFPRIRYEPPTTFKVGRVEDYLVNTIDSRWIKERNIFIVRNEKGIYAMRGVCTHLGCNITWFNEEERFKCPCHGSFFDKDGDVIGGPAPEPLYRSAIALGQDGSIVVDVAQNANDPKNREDETFLLKV